MAQQTQTFIDRVLGVVFALFHICKFYTVDFVIDIIDFIDEVRAMFRCLWQDLFSGQVFLSEDAHRHRVTFDEGVTSGSLTYHQDLRDMIHTLVEDEDWVAFAMLVKEWDETRKKCPAGEPLTHMAINLMVTETVGEMIANDCGAFDSSPIPAELIERFEFLTATKPDLYPLAAITADLHMRQAWFLRGGGYADTVTQAAWEAMEKHFAKAIWLLEVHDPYLCNSPLLAATKFRLCDHMEHEEAQKMVRSNYGAWRDLDPNDLQAHQEYAFKMLPRWYGDYAKLDAGLRQSISVGGAKAYATGYLHVFEYDDDAVLGMDADVFLQGISDLVQLRANDPIFIAQTCRALYRIHLEILQKSHSLTTSKAAKAKFTKAAEALHQSIRHILCNQLIGLHPKAWDDDVTSSFDFLSRLFQPEIKDGAVFHFGANGLQINYDKPEA